MGHVEVSPLRPEPKLVRHELHLVLLPVSSGVGPAPGLYQGAGGGVWLAALLAEHSVLGGVTELVAPVQVHLLLHSGPFGPLQSVTTGSPSELSQWPCSRCLE